MWSLNAANCLLSSHGPLFNKEPSGSAENGHIRSPASSIRGDAHVTTHTPDGLNGVRPNIPGWDAVSALGSG
jgi:hypothetical protein